MFAFHLRRWSRREGAIGWRRSEGLDGTMNGSKAVSDRPVGLRSTEEGLGLGE